MSKRKGLSLEEKREKMLEIFIDSKDVFQLKDIEKIAPKEKGIIVQSVKEVLQSLCDDGLVQFDKIGISNYYWAFPSTAGQQRASRIKQLQDSIAAAEEQKKTLSEQKEESQRGKEDSADRAAQLGQLAALEREDEALSSELARYRDCDPEVIKNLDNILSVKKHCATKHNMEAKQFNQAFGVPEDLDYL